MRVIALVLVALLTACGSQVPEPSVPRTSDLRVPVVVYAFPSGGRPLRLSSHTVLVERSTYDQALLAVRALMDVPPRTGQESLWQGLCRPGREVLAVEREPARVSVRLRDFDRSESGDATCDLSREGWNMQRQQVAWTVRTATGSTLPVRVVLDDGYEKWPAVRAQERFLDPDERVTR
jgi:hypothetical protein